MTLNTILRWTAITSIFAVLIIPFIVANDLFFPFITGKNFFFRVVVEIGFAAWLILSLSDASVRPRKSLLMWSVLGFIAVIGIANIFGENPWKSFWSNFERMEGFVSLLHLLMYFVVASSILNTEKLWKRFLESSFLVSLFVSLYAVFQLSGQFAINQGGVRVDATFGNATYLAIYLIFNIFFGLILMVKDGAMWKKVSLALVNILHLVILYHTATRGAILGVIGGLLISGTLIAIFNREDKRLRIAAAAAIGAIILLIGGFFMIKDTEFAKNSPVLGRFASLSWNETKTQARSYIWPMAIGGWKENPILGWGQENFNYIFNEKYDPRMYNHEQWFDHTHNIILDWLVAGGLLGLLGYLSLFASALYLLWKKAIETSFAEKALLTGLGGAYMFHNLFVFDNIVSSIMFFSVLGLIHFKSTRLSLPVGAKAEEIDGSDMRVAGPVILVGLIFALYFFNWRGYATASELIVALRAANNQPVAAEAAVAAYEKALAYDTLGYPEVVERVVESARSLNAPGVPLEIRQRYFDMAKKAVDRQVERFENDARYEVFAGNFYSIYGQNAEALKHLEHAVELSPRKQTILFQLGSVYIMDKQYEKALETFKTAYELEPEYAEAKKFYGASLIYVGKEAEARELLGAGADDAFLSAYADLGRWDKVIPILRDKANANPKDQQTYMNLVAAYYQSGNKAAAVSVLREMIEIDPSFKETGEQYIKEIEGQ